jgi:signal transduction histidine kinase/ligand-binding sensor domain-containing protein
LSIVALGSALALDPNQPLSYIATHFTVEDGLPDNVVNAIVQTRNGILWVGTTAGLASFDGRHFTVMNLPGPASTSHGIVRALAEAPDGDLWVGTDNGLVRIPAAAVDHFESPLLTIYHPGDGRGDEIACLYVSHEGILWAGTNDGLYRFELGKLIQVIPAQVLRMAEGLDGHLLLITSQGFIEWNGHEIVKHPGLANRLGVQEGQIRHVFQDRTGAMWFCTPAGVARRVGDSFHRFRPYGVPRVEAHRAYQDPQGNVWVYTTAALYRASANRLEVLAPGVTARAIYADFDGNLWVGTNGDGLVRFKDRAVRMFTTADGLPSNVTMAVLSSHDGALWVGNNCGGLSVFDGKRFKTYNEKDGLSNSCVWALAEDGNHDLWIGTWFGGLYRFRGGRFTQYSKPEGLVSDIVLRIVVARDGSLWLATPSGASHMQNGRFRNYTIADGLSSDHVLSVYQDRGGNIWAETDGGIDRLAGDRFVPFSPARQKAGRLCIRFAEDSLGDLYAAVAPSGITLIEGNQFLSINDDLEVLDMVESPQRDLWFSGRNGIMRVAALDLKQSGQDRQAPLDYALFGRADGMNSTQCSVGAPDIALSPDGKLWVATVKGLAMLDLARLPRVNRKPKIFVGVVTIGPKTIPAGRELVLAPGTNHVELRFDAVDLTSPEDVRLQYRMDDVDSEWLEADTARTAIYTIIPAGTHAFRVRATGSDGVWDRTGIVYNVTQQPYFYQATWFRLVSLSALCFLLFAFYQVRVRRIIRQTHIRLEERLVERERIARELHDTLLQGFLSASMQLHVANNRLPAESPAKSLIVGVLDLMGQVIKDGRNAVRGLRLPGLDSDNLEQAFSRLPKELAVPQTVDFRVMVEGQARPLHPAIRDELYQIGREALANAVRHSQASAIEVELEYSDGQLRVVVRDNGCGVDEQILRSGREGHWGLSGMRERAGKIGSRLKVWSRVPGGTEIELSVPSHIAFRSHSGNGWPRWLRRFHPAKGQPENQKDGSERRR